MPEGQMVYQISAAPIAFLTIFMPSFGFFTIIDFKDRISLYFKWLGYVF